MPRPKSNELNKEMEKTSELLGAAFLNAIRLAVQPAPRRAQIGILEARCKTIEEMELVNALCRLAEYAGRKST